ncbi:MAG: dihydrodipicolinate synthase family protein [Nitrospinota bacterium]
MASYKKSESRAYCRANMKGIWAAIPYPFDKNDNIAEDAFRADIRHYIDNLHIKGFFVGGMIGEFWCLTKEERLRGQAIACDEAGEVPIIAHTGHTSAKEAAELANAAAEAGATYVIMSNPYLGAQGIPARVRAFFKDFCSNVDLGVSLFNSGATGYSLSPELVRELVDDNENICCIKNAQPKAHCDEVREAVGEDIVVSDPMETQWFFNRAYHKQQTYMSGPDPFLYQRTGNLGMEKYTDLIDGGKPRGGLDRQGVDESDPPHRREVDLGSVVEGRVPDRRAEGLDGSDGHDRRADAGADDPAHGGPEKRAGRRSQDRWPDRLNRSRIASFLLGAGVHGFRA